MSIDEAIAKYKEITNTDANCPAHCNISCDKCVQESRQLVEWLEELKAIKDGSIPIIHGKAELELHDKEIYNKAIDDFAENISLEISESIIWGMLVNSHKDNSFNDTSDKIADYVINTANEIAEQLKAGGENERSI